MTVEDERGTYSTSPHERSRSWHSEAGEGTIWHNGDRHLRGQQTGEVGLALFFARQAERFIDAYFRWESHSSSLLHMLA